MHMTKYAAAVAIGLAAFAGQASATQSTLAQVSSFQGALAIEQDGRTVALTSATSLKAGDRIVSMEDGKAQIKFADGCAVMVQPNAVTTVGETSPCAASGLVSSGNPMDLGENSTFVWGGLAFIAALALFYTAIIDDNHNSISP